MGYGKTMTDKFMSSTTSQGHYLAEFREGQKACLPDNPRELEMAKEFH